MATAQITPPAPRIDTAGRAYCLPVVRELPAPVAARELGRDTIARPAQRARRRPGRRPRR